MFTIPAAIARIFASVVEIMVPVLKAVMEGLVWFVKALWEGFKDVIDSFYTVLFVLVVLLSGYLYGVITVDNRSPTAVDRVPTKIFNKFTKNKYRAPKRVEETKTPKRDWTVNWERFGN